MLRGRPGHFCLGQSKSAEDLRLDLQRPARPTHGRSIDGRLVLAALLSSFAAGRLLPVILLLLLLLAATYGLSITTMYSKNPLPQFLLPPPLAPVFYFLDLIIFFPFPKLFRVVRLEVVQELRVYYPVNPPRLSLFLSSSSFFCC